MTSTVSCLRGAIMFFSPVVSRPAATTVDNRSHLKDPIPAHLMQKKLKIVRFFSRNRV